MTPLMKDNPALLTSGERSIYGYFDDKDIPILAKSYPMIGIRTIAKIASVINAPRLLEVTTILEVVHRYLEGSFSRIRGVAINVVANPLSVLYWDKDEGQVRRIKTHEIELMHGASEKLALRTDGVAKVNNLLDHEFGLQLAFACSCCVLVVATEDAAALFASPYYAMRETKGRLFDSDMLCMFGALFSIGSVADISADILDSSADFHQEEAASYVRFEAVNRRTIELNTVVPQITADAELVEFFTGRVAALA